MKKEKSKGRKICSQAAMIGLCACMTVQSSVTSIASVMDLSESDLFIVSSSNADLATESDALAAFALRSIGTGDLWENWVGDLSFLSGEKGDGTEDKPYQISTKEQIMGLSELAAKGMVIEESEGTYPGDYAGAYFKLTRNIDLGGMDWMPIGFYCNEVDFYTGEVRPFIGHFDGNGKTVSNFRIYKSDWKNVGLFGVVEDSEIVNLTVKPGYVLSADESAGILVGCAGNSMIRDVTVAGTLRTSGNVGGIAGEIFDGTVIENCVADHVAMDSGTEKETFAGGIAGKAAESLIVDCEVNTGDSYSSRIQGGGYVGGIVGFQNGTDIFNVHVMGTIGGSGSQAIGGVTGKYASGKVKVARFEGTIGSSGLGSLAREGTFIGTHDTGFHFRYGTSAGADLAYLFANTEGKIAAGVCGSGIPDDNSFGYDAHIGFWHGKDNFFTLVQGQNTRAETDKYFYEELEDGVLHLIDMEEYVREMDYSPDHFAPNSVGRPTRGYLVSVLQIDTTANTENYYDVATLVARGESAYCRELDKETRGAVAAGDVVTVVTAPNNTEEEKYQMEGVPTYTDVLGVRTEMAYQTGGFYSFVMPAHDTEISAEYKKVAAEVSISPEEFMLRVVQKRSGDRKNPSIVTEVKDAAGKLIARYISDALEEGTQVQEVKFDAVVDQNNDVADSRVSWSVDDGDLLILKRNGDEDSEGYTAKSASVELNLDAAFFTNIIRQAEQEQAKNQYRYKIPDTVYGNGVQGGLAVLTAKTRPAASFEGKPAVANCKIPVTFRIEDNTYLAGEAVSLNMSEMEFVVTRTLTGSRKNPVETFTVTASQALTANITPEYFDKKSITWQASDATVLSVDGKEKSASVSAVKDAKWIQDIVKTDLAEMENNPKALQKGSGKKDVAVTVIAEDMLGNVESTDCKVTVRFETVDKTYLYGSSGASGGSSSGGSSGGVSSSGGSSSGGSSLGSGSSGGSGISGAGAAGTAGPGGVTGVWEEKESGIWMFTSGGHVYQNEWAYVYNPYAKEGQSCVDWFWFDENGHMATGWQWIAGADGLFRCYYLNPMSDGTKGRLYCDGVTPDGYEVNTDGAWTINGVEQVRETLN